MAVLIVKKIFIDKYSPIPINWEGVFFEWGMGDLGFFLKFGYFFLINGRGDIGGKNIGKITKIVFTDFVKRSFKF